MVDKYRVNSVKHNCGLGRSGEKFTSAECASRQEEEAGADPAKRAGAGLGERRAAAYGEVRAALDLASNNFYIAGT